MKNGIQVLLPFAALLVLSACSGDASPAKPGPGTAPPAPSAGQPAPSPAPSSPAPSSPAPAAQPAPAPAAAAGSSAPAPQDATKPLPRGRVDITYVKGMFGRDPATPDVESPGTPEKVALGRALYHATSWSGDGARSCASCHPLAAYGTDGKPTGAAAPGHDHPRNVPTTWNAFRQYRQGWDGRVETIEQMVAVHALAADGNALGDDANAVAKLKADAALAAQFAAAFPGGGDAVTAANAQQALGAFLRTLRTKSKWEAWLDGDAKALGNDEIYGLEQFIKVGCTTCHATRLVGGNMMQRLGVVKPYSSTDPGRMGITKSDADKSMFKVPSLLNVEKTAPYLHDGKGQTLEQVVMLMVELQIADRKVTPEQVRGIVAFLKALTGPLPADAGAAAPPPAGK